VGGEEDGVVENDRHADVGRQVGGGEHLVGGRVDEHRGGGARFAVVLVVGPAMTNSFVAYTCPQSMRSSMTIPAGWNVAGW
jgi:hypothetical protein